MSDNWNPYYLAYCKAKGVNPGSDRNNVPFMNWMAERKQEYAELFPDMLTDGGYMLGNIIDHEHWGRFVTNGVAT